MAKPLYHPGDNDSRCSKKPKVLLLNVWIFEKPKQRLRCSQSPPMMSKLTLKFGVILIGQKQEFKTSPSTQG
jgi:hypothetical protein